MPDMNGGELAKKIKASPEIADTHLILLSSIPRRGDAVRMLAAGFGAYLTKPVKQSQIYDAIVTLLGLAQTSTPGRQQPLITQHSLIEAARGRFRILLVEDNIVNQKVAARMLEKAGYRCDVAANGLEALEALDRIPYDLLFMDCQMPEMDGYEATRQIRKREADQQHTPIIAMTANAMKGDRELCLKAGMDDYISKPVSAAAINDVLEKHLKVEEKNDESGKDPENIETKPVHIERLQEIADGDTDFEQELIRQFLLDLEKHLKTLDAALNERNLTLVKHEAHSIKGSSANMGAMRMEQMACQMESIGKGKELADASNVLLSMNSELEELSTFFEDYLTTR